MRGGVGICEHIGSLALSLKKLELKLKLGIGGGVVFLIGSVGSQCACIGHRHAALLHS